MSIECGPCGVDDLAVTWRGTETTCQLRGYCGPFVNEEYYAGMEEEEWRGMADCRHCGRTVAVVDELEKWEAALWKREFGIDPNG